MMVVESDIAIVIQLGVKLRGKSATVERRMWLEYLVSFLY